MTFFKFSFVFSKLPIEVINIGISIVIHIGRRSVAIINILRLHINARHNTRWWLSPRIFGLAQIHEIDEKSYVRLLAASSSRGIISRCNLHALHLRYDVWRQIQRYRRAHKVLNVRSAVRVVRIEERRVIDSLNYVR